MLNLAPQMVRFGTFPLWCWFFPGPITLSIILGPSCWLRCPELLPPTPLQHFIPLCNWDVLFFFSLPSLSYSFQGVLIISGLLGAPFLLFQHCYGFLLFFLVILLYIIYLYFIYIVVVGYCYYYYYRLFTVFCRSLG